MVRFKFRYDDEVIELRNALPNAVLAALKTGNLNKGGDSLAWNVNKLTTEEDIPLGSFKVTVEKL